MWSGRLFHKRDEIEEKDECTNLKLQLKLIKFITSPKLVIVIAAG